MPEDPAAVVDVEAERAPDLGSAAEVGFAHDEVHEVGREVCDHERAAGAPVDHTRSSSGPITGGGSAWVGAARESTTLDSLTERGGVQGRTAGRRAAGEGGGL